jgi:hypothetical protein
MLAQTWKPRFVPAYIPLPCSLLLFQPSTLKPVVRASASINTSKNQIKKLCWLVCVFGGLLDLPVLSFGIVFALTFLAFSFILSLFVSACAVPPCPILSGLCLCRVFCRIFVCGIFVLYVGLAAAKPRCLFDLLCMSVSCVGCVWCMTHMFCA